MFTACHPVLACRPGSRSPCGCSAASRPPRSPAPTWCPRPRWPSGSCGPRRRSPRPTSRSRCPRAPTAGPAAVGARGHLPGLQRGLLGHRGDDWMRPELCADAVRLARMLSELVPDEPEVHGLAALMEIQASRLPPAPARRRRRPAARPGPDPLGPAADQSGAGRAGPAEELGGAAGPYALQARIAACHARPSAPRTPTGCGSPRCTALLAEVMPSPVVELNRAVAVSMATARGPGWTWSTRWPRARAAATTCCPAFAATCWRSWAGSARRAPSSSGRPRSPRNERERELAAGRARSAGTD